MGLRETLDRRPKIAIALALAAVALAGAVAGVAGHTRAGDPNEAYYSSDDGATWFADEANKPSGFDHDGQPAYRAYVFRIGSGKPFVGYLERYTPQAQAKIDAHAKNPTHPDPTWMQIVVMNGQEVKKPGTGRWYKRKEKESAQITDIEPPDGSSDDLVAVTP